jgi:hypothetical protein
LVFGDAFNDLSVPYHLATREVAVKVRRLLAPQGAYVANIIDDPARGEFMRAYVRTLGTVFEHVAVVSNAPSGDLDGLSTYVVVASARPLDGAPVPWVPPARVAAWLAGGPPLVLTDDYAPVDNLMAPRFAERGR